MEGSTTLYLPTSEKTTVWTSSLPFLNENNFTLLKSNKQQGLLEGPRRVLRLCLFVLILPVVLITIPLYVRLVLYPPGHYAMMPTDQRLLNRHISSVWCQAQTTHMNGSYNAYLTDGVPALSSSRRTHTMLRHLSLQDDIKEYWGFYFLKGTTISLATCTKWDGGQLMILRGIENLRRCAWLGEMDSDEDVAEDDNERSNENNQRLHFEQQRVEDNLELAVDAKSLPGVALNTARTGVNISSAQLKPTEYDVKHESERTLMVNNSNQTVKNNSVDQSKNTEIEDNKSDERRKGLTELLREAIKMSKNKKEIMNILHNEHENENGNVGNKTLTSISRKLKDEINNGRKKGLRKKLRKKKGGRDENMTEEELPKESSQTRLRRSLQTPDVNAAIEEDVEEMLRHMPRPLPRNDSVETLLGGHLMFTDGVKFERGILNQTNSRDKSMEEHISSYSSSEEALARCEGVILTLPLVSYKSCSFSQLTLNKISYEIPADGTYYFVFSSDNEIYVNDLYFNLTMQRTVYDVGTTHTACHNSTSCTLPLSFWTDEQAVVEVPEGPDWDKSFLLDTKCEPRVYVYLTLILLVPLLIMCCAFH